MMKSFSILLILPFLFLTLSLSFLVQAEDNTGSDAVVKKAEDKKSDVEKERSWWQLRQDRSDIFYPHKPHMGIMKKDGDACMLCHTFNKNNIHDEKILKPLNKINNEPLEAICHDCHVEKINAPSDCRICHPDPATVWPEGHNYDYKNNHTEDARADQDSCTDCHKQLSFCTDCHFKRNFTGSNVHRLGYKTMHGLDARIAPAECGSCHQADYCSDCHQRSR